MARIIQRSLRREKDAAQLPVTDGRQKLIAYAVGCNPDVDTFDGWSELAHAEFGGDDFGEFFDPREGVFALILQSANDLEVSATATHLSLLAVAPVPNGN